MKITPSSKIYCAESRVAQAGRGVFASQILREGDTIERCLVIVLERQDVAALRETQLVNYYFRWGDEENFHRAAICLGFGELYNHSYTPNATYQKNYEEQVIEFIALRDISLNEEITVNYNGTPGDHNPIWMKDVPEYNSSK